MEIRILELNDRQIEPGFPDASVETRMAQKRTYKNTEQNMYIYALSGDRLLIILRIMDGQAGLKIKYLLRAFL